MQGFKFLALLELEKHPCACACACACAQKKLHTQYTCLASRPATFDILTPHDMDSSTADSRLITVLNNKLIKNDNRVVVMIKVTNDKLAR